MSTFLFIPLAFFAFFASLICIWMIGFLIWIYTRHFFKLHPLYALPGAPLSNPFFGELTGHYRRKCRLFACLLKNRRLYGRVRRVHLPFGEIRVEISDYRWAKHVLQSNARNYSRGNLRGVEGFQGIVGSTSLLITSGAYHKHLRKLANPAFKQTLLKAFIPVFSQRVRRLVDKWASQLEGKESVIVPVKIDLSNLTLDIIGLTAFGHDFDALRTPNEFAEAVRFLSGQCLSVLPSMPGWPLASWCITQLVTKWPDACRFEMAKNFGVVLRLRAEVCRWIDSKLIDTRSGDEQNLLDIIIQELSAGTVNRDEMQDMAMTFLVAGHETSSIALSWFFLALARNPEWQDLCREEILRVIGDGDPDWESILALKTINACVLETLRLFPPAPYVNRCTLEEDVINGYHIPKGTDFLILTCEIHRDPEVWGEDAEEFRPGRFLGEGVPWDAFMPFGDGVHKCIGYQFATTEIVCIAAELLRRFEFRVKEGDEFVERSHVTLEPQPSLRLAVRRVK